MDIRMCVPVTGKTTKEFVSNMQKIQEIADFVELRVDTLGALDIEFLDELRQMVHKKAIFTCRRGDEGGEYTGTDEMRVKLLQKAIGMFEYVDIELSTMRTHNFIRDDKTKIIISYHNFKETPSYWDMQKIVYDMNQFKPDILKLATMVNKEYEVTKLYRLLTNKPHKEERIVIGMGEKGRMTRILGPLLGSYLTFAASEYGESAPGQIDIDKLKNIYNNLSS